MSESGKPEKMEKSDPPQIIPVGINNSNEGFTLEGVCFGETNGGFGSITKLMFCEHTYKSNGGPLGSNGGPAGSVIAKRFINVDHSGAAPVEETEDWVFYRRVTDPLNPEIHGLTRAVIKGEQAASFVASVEVLPGQDRQVRILQEISQLTDAEFDARAAAIYTYTPEGRIASYAKGDCCGSSPQSTTYTYSTQDGDELDRWLQKRVTDRRNGSGMGMVSTRYLNPRNTVLLEIEEWFDGNGGVTRAYTKREVDAAGRVVKTYSPESIALTGAYAENLDGSIGSIALHVADGLIRTNTYASALPDGLLAEYYDNATLSGTPRAERVQYYMNPSWEYDVPWAEEVEDSTEVDSFSETLVFNETTYEYEYGPNPPQPYSVRWTGDLRIPETGGYVFHLLSNDAVKLKLDGVSLIDEAAELGGDYGTTTALNYTQGQTVAVEIEMRREIPADPEDLAIGSLGFMWTPPSSGGQRRTLDNDVLYSGRGGGGAMVSQSVQRGENGTPLVVKEYEYYSPRSWETDYLPGTHLENRAKTQTTWSEVNPATGGGVVGQVTTTEYYDENGGTSGPRFHDDAVTDGGSGYYPKYVVTRRSVGGGNELVTRETRDDEGRTVFRQGPDGVLHYYQYLDTGDVDHGRMAWQVTGYDGNNSGLPGGLTVPPIPGGFTATVGGENRVTRYEINAYTGETTKVSEYKGSTLLSSTGYVTIRKTAGIGEFATVAEGAEIEERRVYSEIYYDAGDLEWKVARPVQVTISEPGGNTVSSSTAELLSWA
ncbi:MAG: PA14 domain-containing protein, partial [Planctomycetota bacterium]